MSDPIADLLTRIRNGYMAQHKTVTLPGSRLKAALASVLVKEGFIAGMTHEKHEGPANRIILTLRYPESGIKVLHEIKRVSRPGRRVYVAADRIPKYKGGLGISVLSTSRGLMTDRAARKENIGGELLCRVW